MEVRELVNVAVNAPHTEEGCPFCRDPEKVNESNYVRADYNEDTEADNDTDNHSGTLASNLGDRPGGPDVPAILKGEDAPILDIKMASMPGRTWHQWVYDAGLAPVLYGAHHLIPGNDAMGKSNIYKNKWLGPTDNGADPDNIGYNINSASNGYWLPGNYAIRPWKGLDPQFQQAYAFLAMHDAKRQLHDSHEPFSEYIRGELDALEKLLKKMKNKGCPVCGAGAGKNKPAYHLNSRLNAISEYLKKKLTGSPRRWKDPAFTSGWSPLYKAWVVSKGDKADSEIEKLRRKRKIGS